MNKKGEKKETWRQRRNTREDFKGKKKTERRREHIE